MTTEPYASARCVFWIVDNGSSPVRAPVLVADRLVLAAVAAWKYVPKVWAAHQARVAAEQQRLAAIASRADQQHNKPPNGA